jgi:hypothetical protein
VLPRVSKTERTLAAVTLAIAVMGQMNLAVCGKEIFGLSAERMSIYCTCLY